LPGGAYLLGVASYAPTFLLWSSPGYSNNGFILLGLAMANVTGQTVGKLYQDNIFDAMLGEPYCGSTTGPRWSVRLEKGPVWTQPPPVPGGNWTGPGEVGSCMIRPACGMASPSPPSDVSEPSKTGESRGDSTSKPHSQ